MDQFNVYKDIQARTGGEIYIGVVGPVRTGKSTFIRRFMEHVMIPNMDEKDRQMAVDEIPVSGKGRMVTTVEPKFIPKNAVNIQLNDDVNVKMRLIDCVGYMVDGATGHQEEDKERMVKTPWFTEEIPFTRAAHIGTQKVIKDHSTVGVVMTSDGTFGEIPRENFVAPEEQTVEELKKIGKPFVIILNSSKPYSDATKMMEQELSDKYQVSCLALNCDQLRKEDIQRIMEALLMEFPISQINFFTPKWLDILPVDHPVKTAVFGAVKSFIANILTAQDVRNHQNLLNNDFIEKFYIEEIDMANGNVRITLSFDMKYYYELLSQILDADIQGEYEFLRTLQSLVEKKKEYDKVAAAVAAVHQKGYGVVTAERADISVMDPELIKHGNKFGVNIKAKAPSIHMISADIETEIAPIVGNQQQAQDLIDYINASSQNSPDAIWDTLIFGKSVGDLVDEGMRGKVSKMTEECQMKLQETLKKIINDSKGNVIFVII